MTTGSSSVASGSDSRYAFLEHRLPGPIGADDEYWKGLARGEFVLSRCASCKTWIWPANYRCAACGSWELEWVPVEPVGRVFSWTRTWFPFDRVLERRDQLPYVVVLAEIPEADGARVMGVLHGPDERLAVGAPVRGIIKPPSREAKGYPSIVWQLT
jgi:uncharacterized OB-fold protein